jgi:8-hydroxy-5-deazaflavin:NADPH oxidoreductase
LTTAIIGVGNIGSTVARHLVAGDETVVLAAKDEAHAQALANELGPLARAASVDEAIGAADSVVLALWLDQIKELVPEQAAALENKVVVDPSNPLGFDENGQMPRTLPDDQSAGSIVASLLPANTHYVKAFGTLSAESLAEAANREPRVALFYATDDDDVVWHGGSLATVCGIDAMVGLLNQFLGALSGLHAEEQEVIANGDLVAVRLLVNATHTGDLLVPATGRRVQWDAVDIYRVTDDGKISEEWASDDTAAFGSQLGAFTLPWAGCDDEHADPS